MHRRDYFSMANQKRVLTNIRSRVSDRPIYQSQSQLLYLRNIQLQRAEKMILQLYLDVIKRSINLQLWIMVTGGWY